MKSKRGGRPYTSLHGSLVHWTYLARMRHNQVHGYFERRLKGGGRIAKECGSTI